MAIPHYVNENRSDMRGIKPGWYAEEDDGSLSSGPFSSRDECLNRVLSQRTDRPRQSCVYSQVKQFVPTSDPRYGRRVRGSYRELPLKDVCHDRSKHWRQQSQNSEAHHLPVWHAKLRDAEIRRAEDGNAGGIS